MSDTIPTSPIVKEKESTTPISSITTPINNAVDKPADINLIKEDRPIELFRSYDQGIMDGLLEIRTDHFEQFIDAYHFREFKNKSIYHLRGQIKELLDKQATAKEKLQTLTVEKHNKQAERDGIAFQLNFITKVITHWKEKLSEGKENYQHIHKLKTDYTLFPGILFFLFAVLFIAADYAICLSIVADTLKIGLEDGKKTFSSHLFALAMSGLAIVLKPAYDRLIEKPYHNDGKKKRFALTIVALAALVLGMLLTLGIFREDVISSGLMDAVTNDAGIADPTQIGQPVADAPKGLEHDWAKKIGIVSSTLLFSIAGAVCLGISLPILFKNFRIQWNRMRLYMWNRQEWKWLKKQADLETQKAKAEYDIKTIEQKIEPLAADINVNESINDKRLMIQMYQHGEMAKNIAKSTSLYLAGVERGRKLIGKVPQDWLFDNVYNNTPGGEKGQEIISVDAKTTKDQSIIGKRTRPFVALRRMITHNFKKKWDKENEINIEYYNFDN